MTLKQYFLDKPRGAKAAMAEAMGVSRTWVALIISGARMPGAELAVAIHKYTNGEVSKKELRPDLFGDMQ